MEMTFELGAGSELKSGVGSNQHVRREKSASFGASAKGTFRMEQRGSGIFLQSYADLKVKGGIGGNRTRGGTSTEGGLGATVTLFSTKTDGPGLQVFDASK